jgi:ribosomal-protein-alanine N-acetyltransferase
VNLQIRAAASADFAQLHALDQACFAPGIAYSKAELRYFLRYPGNVGLVAVTDGTGIAGFAIAGIQRRQGTPVGRLITIDVDPEWRRLGVGHALMQAIEERLRQAGATAIVLEVAVDNLAAQQFYSQHGFTATGRIPGYYLGRLDALVMEKPLAA